MFSVLPAALRALIAVRLWGTPEAPATLQPLSFQLRHVHAVTNDSRNIFSTISTQTLAHDNTYTIRTRNILAHKAQSPSDYQSARFRSMRYMENEALAWDSVELRGPNVESRDTLRQLAEMTFDTYLQPGEKGWYDVGPEWNTVRPVLFTRSYHEAYASSLVLLVRMGARCRWSPRTYICVQRRVHRRGVH